MAVCDIQALLAANPCLASAPVSLIERAEIQLLCDFKAWLTDHNVVVTCDIQTLLNENPCNAAIPDGLVPAVRLQLLCDLIAAIQELLGP